MATVSWEYSALYYLNWWYQRDRAYCQALAGTDREAHRNALCNAATYYGVARNLELQYDRDIGLPRLQPITDAVMSVTRADFADAHLVGNILALRDRLSKAYGGNDLLSLTTKFLWLRFQQPIVIYDGNARRVLGTTDGDLQAFYTKWRADYARQRVRVQDACDQLPTIYKFCIDESATRESVAKLAAAAWFQERVFDIYLWHAGA